MEIGPFSDENKFSRSLVDELVETLEKRPLPHLTPSEMEHLIVLIQMTLEASFPSVHYDDVLMCCIGG